MDTVVQSADANENTKVPTVVVTNALGVEVQQVPNRVIDIPTEEELYPDRHIRCYGSIAKFFETSEPSKKPSVENQYDEKYVTTSVENAIHWRINFRVRNRVQSDQIHVTSTTPPEDLVKDPVSVLEKNADGQTVAYELVFCHELKESTYKNKYKLMIDNHQWKFSERDDSILISCDGDATVHMGTSSNALFRNRNMAMEELRNTLKLNLRVSRSVIASNNADQMGQVNLEEFVDAVTADNVSIMMDSFQNVKQLIEIHKAPLNKLTVWCAENYARVGDMEHVKTAKNLKLSGGSNISDSQLMALEANNFEIKSDKISSEGLNVFIKAKLAGGISDDYLAVVYNNASQFNSEAVLDGIKFIEYADEEAYTEMNGSLPIILNNGVLGYVLTKDGEKLVISIGERYFELFKESQKPRMLYHDFHYYIHN